MRPRTTSVNSTSLGRIALPPGMFSAAAMIPMTFTGGLSAATACIAPSTVAPPPMSVFMLYMPSAGLMSRPPESKVIVLPTSATVFVTVPSGS